MHKKLEALRDELKAYIGDKLEEFESDEKIDICNALIESINEIITDCEDEEDTEDTELEDEEELDEEDE